MVLSGVVPLLLEWTGLGLGVPSLFIKKPPVPSGERERLRPSPLKLADTFFRPVLALVEEIGRGGLLGEAGSDKGSEPVPTSAALMLIDRFFFGPDFFPDFSSFSFFFEDFSSAIDVLSSPPPLSLAFSSGSGVVSIIFPLEFFLFSLIEDLESLLLAFLPLSLPSIALSPSPLVFETLEI